MPAPARTWSGGHSTRPTSPWRRRSAVSLRAGPPSAPVLGNVPRQGSCRPDSPLSRNVKSRPAPRPPTYSGGPEKRDHTLGLPGRASLPLIRVHPRSHETRRRQQTCPTRAAADWRIDWRTRTKTLQIGMFVSVSKAAIRHRRIEGSNPSPSAQQSGASHKGAPLQACGGLNGRTVQSTEVHAHTQESTNSCTHWRTTGARVALISNISATRPTAARGARAAAGWPGSRV